METANMYGLNRKAFRLIFCCACRKIENEAFTEKVSTLKTLKFPVEFNITTINFLASTF